MKFVVYAPPYRSDSGGVIALHKLAHNLAELGEESYIYASVTNHELKGIPTQNPWHAIDAVVVYPEIEVGNPLNSKRVVRWLLNSPGALGGDGKYGETDLVYKYADIFKYQGSVKGKLTAMHLDLNKWVDRGLERKGQCYTVRKGTDLKIHEPDAVLFDHTISESALIHLFNTKKTFICYDELSFLLHQAALCGCNSVAIPTIENMPEDKWRTGTSFKYGVAYGVEDMDWCSTKNMVRGFLEKEERESIELTKQFIKDCYEENNRLWR